MRFSILQDPTQVLDVVQVAHQCLRERAQDGFEAGEFHASLRSWASGSAAAGSARRQQRFNFFPLPQGRSWFRPEPMAICPNEESVA
jgi:hypothetical protein